MDPLNNYMIHTFASDDCWVPESKVLKYNEANLQKQKELLSQHSK